MSFDGQYTSVAQTVRDGESAPIAIDSQRRQIITGAVTIAEAVGSITWAAPVAVAMTGASKTFVPADATRKALLTWSPAGNAAAGYDIAGGTVVLATAIQLVPGAQPTIFTGAETPVGIVTAIGTNTQNLYYQSGS